MIDPVLSFILRWSCFSQAKSALLQISILFIFLSSVPINAINNFYEFLKWQPISICYLVLHSSKPYMFHSQVIFLSHTFHFQYSHFFPDHIGHPSRFPHWLPSGVFLSRCWNPFALHLWTSSFSPCLLPCPGLKIKQLNKTK